MSPKLTHQRYGKSQVRLSRIVRADRRHEFMELTIDIALSGDFDLAYSEGINQPIVPTDTMKNTVYALAKRQGVESCETFCRALAAHFVEKFAHVTLAEVTARQQPWDRISNGGHLHPHAFVGGGREQYTCQVTADRAQTSLRSGLCGLQVLKTTESGFSGFLRDENTTLADTDDRIFATTITASWPCPDVNGDWTTHRQSIRSAILEVFANRFSPSVQKTLFEMADAAFVACPAIEEISIAMPNQHHLLANLEPLGLENDNEVFVPTSEPFGMISATVQRDRSSP
jgi:urate oxidase